MQWNENEKQGEKKTFITLKLKMKYHNNDAVKFLDI